MDTVKTTNTVKSPAFKKWLATSNGEYIGDICANRIPHKRNREKISYTWEYTVFTRKSVGEKADNVKQVKSLKEAIAYLTKFM